MLPFVRGADAKNLIRTVHEGEVLPGQADSLSHGMIGSGDEGRAMDTVSLHFNKVFCPVTHNILMDALRRRYSLEKWTVTENWMNCQAHREVISGAKSTGAQSPVMKPTGEYWGQYYLIFSLITWIVGQAAPSACLQMSQSWGEMLYTRWSATIQRDFDRLKKWAKKNLRKVNKRK